MEDINSQKSIKKELNAVCGNKNVRGKTVTGYNVWSEDTFLLFETISDGKYLIRGSNNQEIHQALCKGNPDTAKERGRTTRILAKLRTHGLIRKVPHSRYCLVINKERRVMEALIETKRRTYR